MQFHNFVDGKKEFKNPKGFERMTCRGIIGTTSTYFGTLLIIIFERKNYINLFDLIFNVYFERDSVTRYVTNTPLQPYLFSSFEEIKKVHVCLWDCWSVYHRFCPPVCLFSQYITVKL